MLASPSSHAALNTRRPSFAGAAKEQPRPASRTGPLHRHTLSRSVSAYNMVTPAEYESLPPSIQRKYFSPVERLRIAQQSAALKRKTKDQSATAPTFSNEAPSWAAPPTDHVRPKTAHTSTPSALVSPRKSLSSHPRRSGADVNEQQALRFLALPDKVKRSHFTPEELVLLTESSERALRPATATTDDLSLRRTIFDRNGSLCSSTTWSSASEAYYEGDDKRKDLFEMESESSPSFDGNSGPGAELFKDAYAGRNSSVSSSFSARPSIASRKDEIRTPPGRKSFSRKRALSLAPIPLPPPTLLPAVPRLHTSKSAASVAGEAAMSPASKPAATDPEPLTKYYKDSHARQKLRQYLASPEKFEEALEFGFPTGRDDQPERSSSLQSNAEPGLLIDTGPDDLSALGSRDDEDGRSYKSPRTPAEFNERFDDSAGTHCSGDSGVALPYQFTGIKASTRCLSPDINGREMTLRMTLTRPDLRAPEKELYSFQRTQVSGVDVETTNPLALEALTFCDDDTGAHGAFAVHKPSPGGFKKVWRNLCGRA